MTGFEQIFWDSEILVTDLGLWKEFKIFYAMHIFLSFLMGSSQIIF